MFFWFIGTAIVAVGFVFRDPRFDYRLLIVGSVVPILDVVPGGRGPLHSLSVSIGLLAVVMLATAGRKPIRRMLLGLPIGMLLHLVFDAAWNDTQTFWWPFFGWDFGTGRLPILERGVWSVLLEIVGIALCLRLVSTNELRRPERRTRFLQDGQLETGLV